MPVFLYFSPGLERNEGNAKQYDAYADTHFPREADAWTRAGLLNRFDYTPIQFAGGRRLGTGFISSGVLAFDLDHVFADGLITDRNPEECRAKVEKALSLSPSDGVKYMAVPSHRLNGYHIFLPLLSPISSPSAYKLLFSYLVSTHPLLDQQVKDLGRFFYASALPPAIFAKYALFRPGTALDGGILLWQAQRARARQERAKKQEREQAWRARRDRDHGAREFDWSRWEWGEGTRNASLYRAACSLLAMHYPNAEEEWRAKADSTGLGEREIEGIWRSASRFVGGGE